jgi:hypothetical protein
LKVEIPGLRGFLLNKKGRSRRALNRKWPLLQGFVNNDLWMTAAHKRRALSSMALQGSWLQRAAWDPICCLSTSNFKPETLNSRQSRKAVFGSIIAQQPGIGQFTHHQQSRRRRNPT